MTSLGRMFSGTLVLMLVAGGSYAVGVAQGKAVNLPAASIKWVPYAPGNPLQVAALWGDRTKGEYGMLLKMPAGFEAGRHSHTADYHGLASRARGCTRTTDPNRSSWHRVVCSSAGQAGAQRRL